LPLNYELGKSKCSIIDQFYLNKKQEIIVRVVILNPIRLSMIYSILDIILVVTFDLGIK